MKKLILASSSPRRRVLMECMGLSFTVEPSSFDEYLDDERTPQEVAIELGYGKAEDVAMKHPDAYVIGGDLIIVIDGQQLAKPADPAEARAMLKLLSGRAHQAVGSIVLICKNESIHDADVATVDIVFDRLPDNVIEDYIATGDPYDKAGGYARRHPLLSPYIHVNGDHQALTGLSTIQLRKLLYKYKIDVPHSQEKVDELFEKARLRDMKVLV